jgi:ribonuclease P protein component
VILRRRSSFKAAAGSGIYFRCSLFLIQAYLGSEVGVPLKMVSCGITASKKVGNAVYRNRAKRRLRVALRNILPKQAISGGTYVVIAREELILCPWKDVLQKTQEGILYVNKRLRKEAKNARVS